MIIKVRKIKFYVVYLIGTFLVLSVLWWISYAAGDLLRQLIEPSYYSQTTLNVGENVKTVWNEVLEWSLEINFKFKKEVILGDDGLPLCHNWPCSEECKVYDETKESICPWQHTLIKVPIDKKPSMIVKVTKLLLILIVALSVTMILYNGMMYIIQTWQWKEWKSLMKNIALIVVGILISFFSVVIIRLIQSIPTTLDDTGELKDSGYEADNEVLEWS